MAAEIKEETFTAHFHSQCTHRDPCFM